MSAVAASVPAGDVAQFVALTRPYHARLLRIAVALCGDHDQAADLTQEALVRAFKAFHRFRHGQPVLPWLARILRNYYLDTLKTGRARHEVAGHQLAGEQNDPYASVPTRRPDPAKAAETAQLSGWLAEELAQLPPDQRLIIILCDVEELSYKEAAEVAGIPVGTVRSRLSRCRDHLRQRLRTRMDHDR